MLYGVGAPSSIGSSLADRNGERKGEGGGVVDCFSRFSL